MFADLETILDKHSNVVILAIGAAAVVVIVVATHAFGFLRYAVAVRSVRHKTVNHYYSGRDEEGGSVNDDDRPLPSA